MESGDPMKKVLILVSIVLLTQAFLCAWGSLSHRAMTMKTAEQLEKEMPFLKDERYRKIFIAASSEPDAFVKSNPEIHRHLHDLDMIKAYIRVAGKQTSQDKKLEILARAFGNYAHIMEDRVTDKGGYHSSKITFYKFPEAGINNSFIDLVPDLVEFPKNARFLDSLPSNSVDPELMHSVLMEYNSLKAETGKTAEMIKDIPSPDLIRKASSKLGTIITATKRLAVALNKGKPAIMKEIDGHLSDRYGGIDGKGGGMNDCASTAALSIKELAGTTGLGDSDFILPAKPKLSFADTLKNTVSGAVKTAGYFMFHSGPRAAIDAVSPVGVKLYGMVMEKNDPMREFMDSQMAKHAIGIPKDPENPITKFFLTLAGNNNISLKEILVISQENVKSDLGNLTDARYRVDIAENRLKEAEKKLKAKKWWKFWTWGSGAQQEYDQAMIELQNAKKALASLMEKNSGIPLKTNTSSEKEYLRYVTLSNKVNALIDAGMTETEEYQTALKDLREAKSSYEAAREMAE